MSRVIKFRQWIPRVKVMEYWGFFIDPRTGSHWIGPCTEIGTISDQFTGLKDSKGVEIYEGDIMEFDAREWGDNVTNKFQVEFSNTNGWQGAGTPSEWGEWCTIIGNIHQNPELLEGK